MSEFPTGYGLVDHVHLRVRDLDASRRFYAAVLAALGKTLEGNETAAWCDELYVDRADGAVSRIHLAFKATDRAAVDRFHAAGVAAGGTDHGAPGLRPYHAGYYAAFLLDPDGNNVEAVHHARPESSPERPV